MPVLDQVNSILNAARVRLNDPLLALEPTTGNLLDKSNPFAQQATNNGWRRMCSYLANKGFTALKQDVVLDSFPIVATADPAIPCWIDWSGCNDGVTTRTTLTLPDDLLIPYKVWERPHGYGAVFGPPMELFIDGLPGLQKQTRNGGWEWRANRIYIPGALQVLDLRILYGRYLGDFLDTETPPRPTDPPGTPPILTQWFEQLVPLPNCQDAFALYICAELALSYPDKLGDPQAWLDKADGAADLLANREVSMKQRGTYRKRSRSGRLEAGSAWW